MPATAKMTGAQQAAMLVMSLKEEQAAALLKNMSEGSLTKLCQAVESMEVSQIGDDQKRQALQKFFLRQRKGGFVLGDPSERFRKVLSKARGEDAIRRLMSGQEGDGPGKELSHLEFIQTVPDDRLVPVLAKESARAVAVLMAALGGERAGRILNMIAPEQRAPIVARMIASRNVPAEVTQEVLGAFRAKIEEMKKSEGEHQSADRRAQELARMIGTLDRESQEKVLTQIAERDPELGDKVERLMFAFEDLVKVDKKSMQELLRNVEDAKMALALKGAPEAIRKHFHANMSQRARERVDEESEMAGRVLLSEVEAAREELMKLARKMYRDGSLIVQMGTEQYVE